MNQELRSNLEKIRALTPPESLTSVNYRETVKADKHMFSFYKGGGTLSGIYSEPDCSIAIANIEANSVHQIHVHDQTEIAVVLSGKAIVELEKSVVVLEKYSSITFAPQTKHQIVYPQQSRVLVITIPQSKDFPNGK